MTTTDLDLTLTEPTATEASPTELLAGRLFSTGVGAVELCTVYLGITWASTAHWPTPPRPPPSWPPAPAGRAVPARVAAGAGRVRVLASRRRPGQAFALADGAGTCSSTNRRPTYLGGLADVLAATGQRPAAAGRRVPHRRGRALRRLRPGRGQCAVGAQPPGVRQRPGGEWLPQLPDVLARLQDTARPGPGRRPGLRRRLGRDRAGKGVPAHARRRPRQRRGVDRARPAQRRRPRRSRTGSDLEVVDLADESADWSPRYDLALFVECVHDFPRPVEALRNARRPCAAGGAVLVVDERADETFTAPGDDVERFFAAASAVWCLPQGRVGPDPEPVGTLIRPDTMRDLARRAGYAGSTSCRSSTRSGGSTA